MLVTIYVKPKNTVNREEEKALRRQNLEKLLNYDRYSAQVETVEEEPIIQEEPIDEMPKPKRNRKK